MAQINEIVFLLFPDFLELDYIGPLDVFARVKNNVDPSLKIKTVAETKTVRSVNGLTFEVDDVLPHVAVPSDALLVVPGGKGAREIFINGNPTLEKYITSFFALQSNTVSSVCTGSLLLARTGILADRKATTHYTAVSYLTSYTNEVVKARFVEDRRVITSAGVTAGIDMALYVTEKFWGEKVRKGVEESMEYSMRT
ncbi:DJ-1/PfpI family protein [uncultured archaeon]|nr:DJ-1/PfpI family protein [uncultured archaeon]